MKTILVTGASGYVGAKIYKDLLEEGYRVVGTYFSTKLFNELEQCDLTNKDEVDRLIVRYSPNIVIHIAANASNSNVEKDPRSAIDLNVNATKYLVNASRQIGAKFVYVSTFAAYEASGLYGKTKLEAEKIVSELDNYMILRPSLIIGLSPNVRNDRPFNRMLKNVLDGDKKVAYDDSWRFQPTFLSHLSRICMQLVEKEDYRNMVFPVVSNIVTSRYAIAKDILTEFNIDVDATDEKRGSSEPLIDWSQYNRLQMPMMSYEDGIKEIIKDISAYNKKGLD